MSTPGPLQIALRLAGVLESLGVAYHLGGSLASSIHGEPRATNDIDMVVDLTLRDVPVFAETIGADFALDQESLRDAVRRRSSCNMFYLPLFTKIDLFICGNGPYDRAEMRRSKRIQIGDNGESLAVKGAEDTVLRKLKWFRDGGEVSDRQWRDVVQVLRMNRGVLDEAVLDEWASTLGVADLLDKARNAAGEDESPPSIGR